MTGGKGTGIGNRICPPRAAGQPPWQGASHGTALSPGPRPADAATTCRLKAEAALHALAGQPGPGQRGQLRPPPHPAIIPAPSDPPRSCAALRFKAAPNAITAFQCRAATGCFVPIPSIAPIAIPETRRRPLRVAGTKGVDRLLYFQRLAYDYAQRGWLLREDCSTAS